MKTSKLILAAAVAAMGITGSITTAFAAEGYARSSVNVRSGPSTRYARVDALHRNEAVNITECRGNWCYIQHSGPDGWVSANYLKRHRSGQPQRHSNNRNRNNDVAAAAIFGVIAGAIIASH